MVEFYSEKFREIRKRKKINMTYFADKIDVSRRTLWAWENGKRVPAEKKIRLMAGKLDVPVSEISDLTEEYPKSHEQFPKVEKYWKSLIAMDNSGQEHDRFTELLYKINMYRHDLKKSTVIINALLSSMKTMLYIKNSELEYVAANKSFLEMLSLSTEVIVVGKNDKYFFPEQDAEANTEQDETVIRTGKPLLNIEGYIPGCKRKKWGIISKIPVFDAEGNIAGIVGSFVDITDRIKAERQRKLLESVINSAGDNFWIAKHDEASRDFDYLFINEAVKALYDITDKDIKKNSGRLLLSEQEKSFLTSQADDKFPVVLNARIVKQNGKERYLEKRIYKHPEDNIYFGITKDITEQKKNEEEKEILYKLLSRSDDVVGIFDIDKGKYIFINDTIKKVSGYSPEEVYENSSVFLDNCFEPDSRALLKKYREEKKWPELMSYTVTGKDGVVRSCESRTTIDDVMGRKCAIFVTRDITNRNERFMPVPRGI